MLRTLPDVVVEARPLRLRLASSRALMTGWAQPTWRGFQRDGLQGTPLRHTASEHFRARGLQSGDTVYVVGQDDGRLLLITRIHVADVVDQQRAEDLLGEELYVTT